MPCPVGASISALVNDTDVEVGTDAKPEDARRRFRQVTGSKISAVTEDDNDEGEAKRKRRHGEREAVDEE